MATDLSIKLDELQGDVLTRQLDDYLAVAPDASSRENFSALREAIATLEVPAESAAALGSIIEVSLTSGRVRKLYGPGAELSLWALFQKTPRGIELTASIASLNAALHQLGGQPLEFVSVTARAPGAYGLTIRTSQLQMVLRLGPAGASVESIELGGE